VAAQGRRSGRPDAYASLPGSAGRHFPCSGRCTSAATPAPCHWRPTEVSLRLRSAGEVVRGDGSEEEMDDAGAHPACGIDGVADGCLEVGGPRGAVAPLMTLRWMTTSARRVRCDRCWRVRPRSDSRRRPAIGARRGRPWREYSGSAGRWWARDPILTLVQIMCMAPGVRA
jgi:hypothetical protein